MCFLEKKHKRKLRGMGNTRVEGIEQCLGFWDVLPAEKNLSPEGRRAAEPEFCVGAETLLLRGRTASEKIDGRVLCASLQGVYPLAGYSAHR